MRYVMDVYAPDNRYYPKDVKQRALINRSLDYDLSVLSKTCALTMVSNYHVNLWRDDYVMYSVWR